MKIVEYMWVNIRSMLIAPAKIPEQKGSVWVGYCLQVWNKGEGGGLWWREILRGSRRCLPIWSKIQAESAVCGAGLCWWTVAIRW